MSAAMEEWMILAKTVPTTLFTVGFDIEGLLGTVTTARAELTPLIVAVHEGQVQDPRGDISDNLAALLRGPGDHLDDAIRELARLGTLHAAAGHAFVLFAEHVGPAIDEEPVWRSWRRHHAAAQGHAEAALRLLRRAASRARAYEDVVRTAWSLPAESPDWWAWMAASLDFVLFARISGAMALHSLRCMRKAIVREFHDTWMAAIANP